MVILTIIVVILVLMSRRLTDSDQKLEFGNNSKNRNRLGNDISTVGQSGSCGPGFQRIETGVCQRVECEEGKVWFQE